MPTYKEMLDLAINRAEQGGFAIGTPIVFGRRTGLVCDVNPFFFDADPLKIYVDLDACGRFKAKRRELISMDNLLPNTNRNNIGQWNQGETIREQT